MRKGTYKKPKRSTTVRTYDDLRKMVRDFADGKTKFLIIQGRAGLGKSKIVKNELPNVCEINAVVSAIGLYKTLYAHRDELLFIDDADLYHMREAVSVLRQAIDSEHTNLITWTKNTSFVDESMPLWFETSSNVILLTNEWRTLNENVRSLESRAKFVIFEPCAYDIHCQIGKGGWFTDKEVYDFIYDHLHLATELEFRDYISGANDKMRGDKWKEALLEYLLPEDETVRRIRLLLADPRFKTKTACLEEFKKQGGAHATFWRYIRKIKADNKGKQSIGPNPPLVGAEARSLIITQLGVA